MKAVHSNPIADLFQAAAGIAQNVAGRLAEAAEAASKGENRQAIGGAPTEDQLVELQAICKAAGALHRLRAL
jgi:hypothetical protein